MKNKSIHIVISALVLRFALMSFFYHPDLKSQHFHGQFLAQGVFNIYAYLGENAHQLPYQDTFNYPPFTYFFLGSWQSFAHLFTGSELTHWLNDWGPLTLSATPKSVLPVILFWLKLPYLVFDLLLLYFLIKIVSPNKKTLTLYLWAFNPLSLYAIYCLGQFDIVPAFLTLVSYYLAGKKKLVPAVFLLSVAVAFKTYPLLLLPFVLIRASNIKQLALSLSVFILTSLAWILPFIRTPQFVSSVLQSSHGQRLFSASVDIGLPQPLPLVLIFYGFIFAYSWKSRSNPDLLKEFLFTSSLVLIFSHFHAQWAIWSLPFFLVFLSRQPRFVPLLAFSSIFYFLVIGCLPDQFVLTGLFTPLNPELITIPPLTELIQKFMNPQLLQSYSHALLSGLLIFITLGNHEKNTN